MPFYTPLKRLGQALLCVGLTIGSLGAANQCSNSTTPTYTTNAGIPKPAINSCSWGTALNGNFDIIDSSFAVLANNNVFLGTNTLQAPLLMKGPERFYDNSTHYIELQAPASVTTTHFNLPSSDGSSGQFMKTDGSGNLGWGTASGGASSTLGVTTGTSAGFSSVRSTPTAVVNFNSSQFLVTPTGGATAYTELNGSSVTLQGNTFNGASELVLLDSSTRLPIVDGSNLTNVHIGLPLPSGDTHYWQNPSSGTFVDNYGAYFSTITVGTITVSGLPAGQCVQTTTGGKLSTTGTACGSGGGGSPGGPFTSVQFNDSGSFNGSSDFQWSGTSVTVPSIGPGTGTLQTITGGIGIASSKDIYLNPSSGHSVVIPQGSSLTFVNQAGAGRVQLTGPSSQVNTPLTFQLPNSSGTAGQFLSTDGGGVLSWATASGGTGSGIVSPGTFTWTNQQGIVVSTLTAGNSTSTSFGNASYVTINSSGSSEGLTVNSNGVPSGGYQNQIGALTINGPSSGAPGTYFVIQDSATDAQLGTGMMEIWSNNPLHNDPKLWFHVMGHDSSPEIRDDAWAPNWEMINLSTDNAHGLGKFEPAAVAYQGVDLQRNSRAYDNSTFENVELMHPLQRGGGLELAASLGANGSPYGIDTAPLQFDTTNSHVIGLTGPMAPTASWTFALPSTANNSGQVLYQSDNGRGGPLNARSWAFTTGGTTGNLLSYNSGSAPTWTNNLPSGSSNYWNYPSSGTFVDTQGISVSSITASSTVYVGAGAAATGRGESLILDSGNMAIGKNTFTPDQRIYWYGFSNSNEASEGYTTTLPSGFQFYDGAGNKLAGTMDNDSTGTNKKGFVIRNGGAERFYDSTNNSGAHYISWQASTTVASNLEWIWPSINGSDGQFLQLHSNNSTSWETPNNQTITLSGDSTGSGTTAITVTAAATQANIRTFTGAITHTSSTTFTGVIQSTAIYVSSATVGFDAYSDSNTSTAQTINWTQSNVHYSRLTGDVTYTFTAPPHTATLTLLIDTAAGSHAVTWPASVLWSGGTAPTITTTANKYDIVTCKYLDITGKYYCQAAQNF